MWTRETIEIFIEYYDYLQAHELNFLQEKFNYRGGVAIRGKGGSFRAPFITQSDKNIEFDMAIKKLGKLGSQVFRLRWLDGYGLEKINEMLDEPYKDIKESFRTVKGRLITHLLEGDM